jgi:DNA repair ATPase RecN
MAITVRVRDFQSIKDATLVIDGLTAITGPNNTGKSAFLRAIRGAFQNARGNSYVRHGAPYCQVDIEFDDGRSLTWKKGAKVKPTYIINGGKPIHPGAGVPDEVRAFGVVPITAGGREIWPQVAKQLQGQVFLLDEPGSVLAEAVANVDRVGRLNRSLKASEKDKRAVASELKVRHKDKGTQEAELEAFEGLDKLVGDVEVLEGAAKLAGRISRAIEGYTDLRERHKRSSGIVTSLEGVEAIQVPSSAGIGDTLDEIAALVRLKRLHGKAEGLVSRYEGIENVDIDVDAARAEKLVAAIASVEAYKDRLADLQADIDEFGDEADLKAAQLSQAEREVAELLGDLGECPTCGTLCGSPEHGGE